MKTIREIMRTDPVQVRPDDTLRHALELLVEHQISGLPVVGDAGRLVGVLSEKDLLKIFYEDGASTVRSLMSRDPISVSVESALVEVVDQLMAHDFRRVFVHDREKLVGLVSRSDLMPAILEALIERA